jgi:hypothetical protein
LNVGHLEYPEQEASKALSGHTSETVVVTKWGLATTGSWAVPKGGDVGLRIALYPSQFLLLAVANRIDLSQIPSPWPPSSASRGPSAVAVYISDNRRGDPTQGDDGKAIRSWAKKAIDVDKESLGAASCIRWLSRTGSS